MLSLGGYTLAESTTQRRSAVTQQAAFATAQRAEDAVTAERERAVASGRGAVADAAAVRTVAASSLTDAEMAPLTTAVAELTTLIEAVPDSPAPLAESATKSEPTGSNPSVDPADLTGVQAASRGVTPDTAAVSGAGVVSTTEGATDLAGAFAASDAAREAALTAATPTADPTAAPTAAPTDGSIAPEAPAATTAVPGTDPAPKSENPADDAKPDDDMAAGILAAAADVADLTAQVKTTAEAKVAEAQAAAETAAQAALAATAEVEKEAQRASLAAYANGRVPADALCAVGFASDQQLRCDATEAMDRLNASYRDAFGADLIMTDSYRSYAAQVACARTKGRLCATPGTSNHGRGVAVDLGSGVERFGSKQHAWMVAHAGEFGWILPDWASRTGSKSEPWHWEFTG